MLICRQTLTIYARTQSTFESTTDIPQCRVDIATSSGTERFKDFIRDNQDQVEALHHNRFGSRQTNNEFNPRIVDSPTGSGLNAELPDEDTTDPPWHETEAFTADLYEKMNIQCYKLRRNV